MNTRTFRPGYLSRRLRQVCFEKQHPDVPWLTQGAILFLDTYLKPDDHGFEWGSGRSTLWFAHRVALLHSVEANDGWYRRVAGQLSAKGLSGKVRYHHIPCSLREVDEPSSHPYASAIGGLPERSLDFVLVDGHIRATCFAAALPRLKPGGLLILDNANRYVPNPHLDGFTTVHEPRSEPRTTRWSELLNGIAGWRAINTSDGIWDTRFWIKPCC